MSELKINVIVFAFGVLIGLPLVVLLGLQIYTTVVSKVASRVEAPVKFVNAPLLPSHNVSANLGGRVPDGFVLASFYVSIRDLLKPDEKMPDEGFADVLADARAGNIAEAECGALRESLASRCQVVRASATRDKNGKSLYRISTELRFAQVAPLGNVAPVSPSSYREISGDLTAGAIWIPTLLSDAGRQRRQFYDEALRQCEQLQDSEGNCAIHQIVISAPKMLSSDAEQMTGRASYSLLKPAGST